MLSTRGATTTNVALVECAAGQNKADKTVFLLSELEKVWVAVAVVARRLLLEGKAVQIAPFGSLWTEEYVLLRDRQQRPYTTRNLRFGINQTYANRYGIDTGKVPIEQRAGAGCVRVSMADIVAVCGVPARTASAALKEFFMYLGEGVTRGRVFQLALPGVATLAMKQQKVVLTMNAELRQAMFDIDSRKWATELKAEGQQALDALAAVPGSGFTSAQSSRPATSRLSRASWRADPAAAAGGSTASAGDGADGKKAVFVAAAPSGRTFDEIAHQAELRRRAAQEATEAERELRRRQNEIDRRIERYCDYTAYYADPHAGYGGEDGYAGEAQEVMGVNDGQSRSLRPPSASGESIYNILAASADGRRGEAPYQYGRQHPHHHATGHLSAEPEVEVIEMVDDDGQDEEEINAVPEPRPLTRKDAELERVLREEEPFSRPISRRTYHETSAARDLIYSQPYEAPERGSSSAGAGAMHRPSTRRKDGEMPARAEAAQGTVAPTPRATAVAIARDVQVPEETPRFGRKRFDDRCQDTDHVASLLQYREYS